MSIATIVGDDIVAALATLGAEPVDAVCITGLPAEQTDRATFRIALADGRIVKARRFRRAARAERSARLAQALSHEHVPPPLLVSGRITIESWLDGVAISTLPSNQRRLEQAADLLGSLHAPPGAHPHSRSTSTLLASTRRRLASLGGRGTLVRDEVDALLCAMQRLAPAAAAVGITHNDFCADNLVQDAGGRLVLVDNEGLRRGFLDYDLARTWYRWPMPDADWRAFTARYRSWRTPDDRIAFWRIAAVVKSAHLRAARHTAGATVPVDRLRALLASDVAGAR